MNSNTEQVVMPESESLVDSLRNLTRPGWPYHEAAMDAETGISSRRSAQPFVASLEKRIFPVGCRYRQSVQQIVSSLLWVFVARLSATKDWLTEKNQGRMVRSVRLCASRIQLMKHEKEQKYVKYWLDKLLAKLVSDRNPYPSPVEEFREPLFSGFLLRIVQRRLAHHDAGFVYSLQRGAKLAWPKLPDQCLIDTLNAHKSAICRDPTPIGAKMVPAINEVSGEVLGHMKSEDFTKFCPSSSACFEANRKHLGTASLFEAMTVPESSGMGILRDYQNQLDMIRALEFSRFQDILESEGIELGAKVVPIPEPGKFRVISKGSGYLYSLLQPLQGAMLKAWKRHPASTMLTSDLTPRVEYMNARRPKIFNLWASVDYSSATDLLKRMATMAALKGIPEKFSEWRDFAKAAFSQGNLYYPDIYEGEGEEKKCIYHGGVWAQGEGQLMGHPLSFPLLCIINLACYREALSRWIEEGEWDAEDIQAHRDLWYQCKDLVITNGDDMLFPCCQRLYDIFCEVVKEVGFKLSAGKNYLSENYALINSQLFSINGKSVTRRGYLNQRLMMGQCLKSGSSSALPTQIAQAAEQMVRLTPWTKCAIPKIMNRWKSRGQFVPNWYLPVHLGGYGMNPNLAPSSWTVSQTQRKMAARFIREPTLALYRVKESRFGEDTVHTRAARKLAQYAPKAIWEPEDKSRKEEPGDENPGEEKELEFDRWADRFAYIQQWMKMRSGMDVREYFPRKLAVIRNLKPVGKEGFMKYWYRKLIPVVRAPCPPLQPMSLRLNVEQVPTSWLDYFYRFKDRKIMGSHPVIAQIVDSKVENVAGHFRKLKHRRVLDELIDAVVSRIPSMLEDFSRSA